MFSPSEEDLEEKEKQEALKKQEERAENKGHPFCFMPFGGGAHKCIGMHFSQMEYKCFLHKFMLTFDFEHRHKSEDVSMMDFPLPKLILDYRSVSKLKSTYTDKLPEQVNPKTGRVHTSESLDLGQGKRRRVGRHQPPGGGVNPRTAVTGG